MKQYFSEWERLSDGLVYSLAVRVKLTHLRQVNFDLFIKEQLFIFKIS